MRRRGFRKNWVSRQEHLWVVNNTADFSLAAGTVLDGAMVAPSDWVTRAGFEKATYVRSRGWFTARATATGGAGAVYMVVLVRAAGQAVLDPSLTATLRDYDVLWTGGGVVAKVAPADESQAVVMPAIDIRTKRKLTEDQEINFYVRASPGVALTLSYAFRSLIVPK